VVEITVEVVQSNPFYGEYTAQGAGSGVIISEDGYILTNNHVIDGASSINVKLRSGESYSAQLIGKDADVDIALLKVDASGLTAATVGDSSTIGVGDKSVIIGNPLGTLGGSVTEGIVSAVDRTLDFDGKTMHLIQTDAAVNPGNSGGGMFNGQGELVGIVVAKSTNTTSGSTIDNIGFVIPINDALDILGDLKEFGYVRGRASTGMAFSEDSEQQLFGQLFGISGGSGGVYVASVKSGSNAAEAGFNVGDRVIAIDGTEINSISDIKKIITEHSVGDTLSFEVERNGSTGTLSLTLEEYAPASAV
jgi:serine protease Do